MGLKFLPRAGHMVPFAAGNGFGQLPRFAGRTFKASNIRGVAGVFAADSEPVEVDPDGADAAHFKRHVTQSDPGMWPADEATAAYCGVEFVPVALDGASGEWLPAKKPAAKSERQPKAEV